MIADFSFEIICEIINILSTITHRRIRNEYAITDPEYFYNVLTAFYLSTCRLRRKQRIEEAANKSSSKTSISRRISYSDKTSYSPEADYSIKTSSSPEATYSDETNTPPEASYSAQTGYTTRTNSPSETNPPQFNSQSNSSTKWRWNA